jgi:hypothetical protein
MKKYNLVYFVAVIDRPVLWFHLWNIKQNLYKFNGSKHIVLCRMGDDEGTHRLAFLSPEEVERNIKHGDEVAQRIRDYLNDDTIEYYEIENSPLGETPSIVHGIFPSIASVDPNEATFYGHTKGIRYPGRSSAALWAYFLVSECFHPSIDGVHNILWEQDYHAIGAFKQDGHVYGWSQSGGADWHYSGGIFWFRHDAFFSKDWHMPDLNAGVMEYIMPRVIKTEKAYTSFPVPTSFNQTVELYDVSAWERYLKTINSTPERLMNWIGFDGTEGNYTFTKHLK